MSSEFDELMRIMARLRGRNGCPWDKKQTHRSLLKYLKEEAGEVARAVRRRDYENLEEELGDLLLQIAFHAQLAREKGRFDLRDVARGLCRKMVRRHPHVFGKKRLGTAAEVMAQWRELKAKEKAEKRAARRRGKNRRG
ncbi:MAG: MazG family protein [Elusimicrobiota bacterium]